jgi:hypothetical protein
VEQTQELLQRWDDRARRLYPRMEISGEGLMLGAGTVLAGTARDECGRPRLALDDEPRALALLVTAYDRPVEAYILAKIRRAAELWSEGDKALAHIHLAYARLPPCDEEQALRLFVADELLEAGVTPRTLMKAQGFDPAPLDLLKANFNPAQPRWPAGSGRDSGEWSGGANIDTAGVKELIARLLLETARRAARALRPSEPEPPNPEVVKPESKPPEPPEAEQVPNGDPNKLHHIFDKAGDSGSVQTDPLPAGRGLDNLEAAFGSQEGAFRAIESATRQAIKEQQISGEFKIRVEVGGYELTVKGTVMSDGTVKIGTVYPWKE